jgi:hypothetical protein
MEFYAWLESLSFSAWVRESGSLWAFPMFLFVHTLGVSIVAGGSTMISFAVLGLWPKQPIKPLEKLYPVIWAGFAVNAFTGTGLFMADASTRGINPDFWIKLALIFVGVALLPRLRKKVFDNPQIDKGPVPSGAKMLAVASLLCWFGAIICGRLIAYVGPVAGL